jgi:hypothetical protein
MLIITLTVYIADVLVYLCSCAIRLSVLLQAMR